MKKFAILSLSILISAACGGGAERVDVSPRNSNDAVVISSHSSENSATNANSTIVPKAETRTKWTQSGTPIDTSEFDKKIADAEKNVKAKPKDEAAKKALADSYLKRGLALTDARQYASALGDYRRALKYDAGNEKAKSWIDKIIEIYDGLNKDYPKEGEEPPPLPFNKKT